VESYSVRRRSRRLRSEYQFENAITFDPTVGSHSNFYRSFRILFLVVDEQSLLGEAEVLSLETRVPVRRAITFDPTVGSPSNFYMSFRTPFFLD
jgi:hypothetical protein